MGMYKGYSAYLIELLVYRFVSFSIYQGSNPFISKTDPSENKNMLGSMVSVIALFVANLVSYPFQTVNKRMIMDIGETSKKYEGLIDCF